MARSDDVAQHFDTVARVLATLDIDKIWKAATEVEQRVLIEEFLEEIFGVTGVPRRESVRLYCGGLLSRVYRRSISPMPRPGDRHPGFIVEAMRRWAMVYDGRMHANHRREMPSWTRRRFSPKATAGGGCKPAGTTSRG